MLTSVLKSILFNVLLSMHTDKYTYRCTKSIYKYAYSRMTIKVGAV